MSTKPTKACLHFMRKNPLTADVIFFLKTEIRVFFVLKLLICSDSSENEVFFLLSVVNHTAKFKLISNYQVNINFGDCR